MKHLGWIVAATLAAIGLVNASTPAKAGDLDARLSVEECWQCLPTKETDEGQRLPNWARITARPLPKTTAAMLELDWLHRTQNELGPILRAEMRWVAAEASRCTYSMATAEADLRRAGVDDARIDALKGGYDRWPDEDRMALDFASQMTLDAGSITDELVADLKDAYGERKLVAMVLLLAHANFQDRLLLSLGVPLEEGGPLAPVEVHLDAEHTTATVPPRERPEDRRGPDVPTKVDDPEWSDVGFDVLQRNLESQRGNSGRIRIPTFEEVQEGLPAGVRGPSSPVKIRWTLVCMGYQPRLASAWNACTRSFREEAQQDRVFEESLFWVVTRSIHCFY